MIVKVWKRNDRTGLLDNEFKITDVDSVIPDSEEASLGTQDRLSWGFFKMPDPPGIFETFKRAVEEPERAPGLPDENGDLPIRHLRIYRLPFHTKLTPAELEVFLAPNSKLPDGPTVSNGGSVTNGVISGLFNSYLEFVRK